MAPREKPTVRRRFAADRPIGLNVDDPRILRRRDAVEDNPTSSVDDFIGRKWASLTDDAAGVEVSEVDVVVDEASGWAMPRWWVGRERARV